MAKRMFMDSSGHSAMITERPNGTATLKMLSGGKRTEREYGSFRDAHSAMKRLGNGWKEQ